MGMITGEGKITAYNSFNDKVFETCLDMEKGYTCHGILPLSEGYIVFAYNTKQSKSAIVLLSPEMTEKARLQLNSQSKLLLNFRIPYSFLPSSRSRLNLSLGPLLSQRPL